MRNVTIVIAPHQAHVLLSILWWVLQFNSIRFGELSIKDAETLYREIYYQVYGVKVRIE